VCVCLNVNEGIQKVYHNNANKDKHYKTTIG